VRSPFDQRFVFLGTMWLALAIGALRMLLVR
jgi:hypothetical protein